MNLNEDALKCQGIAASFERGACVVKVTVGRRDAGQAFRVLKREGCILLLSPLAGEHSQPPIIHGKLLGRLLARTRGLVRFDSLIPQWMHDRPLREDNDE